MSTKLKNIRKAAVRTFTESMDELALFHTINSNCKGYVFIKRQYENSRMHIVEAIEWAVNTRSFKKIIYCIDTMNRFKESWKLTYNFYREVNKIDT